MRKLSPPKLSCEEVLKSCISNIRDETLYINVNSNMASYELAEKDYEIKGNSGQLHTLQSHEDINGQISKNQMMFLYDKMVKKENPARDYYDKILNSSKKCPFCGYGKSTTLDHFLPKSSFPIYAVTPFNLVPCCKDCNMTKLTKTMDENVLFLHPYFDNVDDTRWLYCDIGMFPDTVAFSFKIVKPSAWGNEKFQRMKYHFETFNLNDLFISYAIDEFSDNLYHLKELHNSFILNGVSDAIAENGIREDLNDKFKSCENHLINHWKTAMYDGLRNSIGFVNWLKNYDY
ncbi:HNH endonuclease signature motif containing protein [Lysinibacillus sp. KU-BSD001]|uniref:HNH endonuclease n=1 Tax=Lysinibacillus sp. KU-BSD001 TaxID=3141328 RepID=UPI0036EC7896